MWQGKEREKLEKPFAEEVIHELTGEILTFSQTETEREQWGVLGRIIEVLVFQARSFYFYLKKKGAQVSTPFRVLVWLWEK